METRDELEQAIDTWLESPDKGKAKILALLGKVTAEEQDEYLVPKRRELVVLATDIKTLPGIIEAIKQLAEVAGHYGDFITYYKLLGTIEELKAEHGIK